MNNKKMKYSIPFCLWFLNTYLNLITAQDSFPALILTYNGENFDLVDINSINDNDSFKLAILACPSTTENSKSNENVFAENQKSLIIKEIHQPPFDIKSDRICEHLYSPNITMIYDMMDSYYLFGYKFYFKDEQLKNITDITGLELDNENLEADAENKLVPEGKNFFWFLLMRIYSKYDVVISEHVVRANRYIGDFKSCENVDLNIPLFSSVRIRTAFEKENQISILNNYMKPNWDKERIEEMYLNEQQLTPIDDFDSYSKRLATCSYLNMAPMWHTIANGAWKTVEEFIKILSEHARIKVTTGTFGLLYLPYSSYPHHKFGVKLRSSTPVPECFWKIVEYHDSVENGLVISRGIVIFTFNYVSGAPLHKPMCEENVCKKFGWNVENDDYKTGFTYCCRAKDDILQKLVLYSNKFPVFDDFNLRMMLIQNDHSTSVVRKHESSVNL